MDQFEAGLNDGKAGRERSSVDPDYLTGYRLGRQLSAVVIVKQAMQREFAGSAA